MAKDWRQRAFGWLDRSRPREANPPPPSPSETASGESASGEPAPEAREEARAPAERAAEEMVEQQLETRGVRDPRVLDAMARIDRSAFVPERVRGQAFEDGALPIGLGQTISQPYMVAAMTELLDVHPGHRVLEIGTGSGYQAAALAALGARVVSVERHRELSERARETLRAQGFGDSVECLFGDGSRGCPERAPFDRIIVTAAAPEGFERALLEQLSPEGGLLVAPVDVGPRRAGLGGWRRDPGQQIIRWRRDGNRFQREEFFRARFVPLLEGVAPDRPKRRRRSD